MTRLTKRDRAHLKTADARETDCNGVFTTRLATPMELVALRKRSAIDLVKRDLPDKFTCDDCTDAARCSLVFDGYNTGGDCLASK